jgi:hypothetical protein
MAGNFKSVTDARGWVTPQTAAAFQALAPGAPLPWSTGDELEREAEMIFDARGRHIATVDEWKSLPDHEALGIAAMIVCAVNTCGGFRQERRKDAAADGR